MKLHIKAWKLKFCHHSNSMYQVIITEIATVSKRHKFQKQMCPDGTGRAYTSANVDVAIDVDNSYLYTAKVLFISRCLSSIPQAHGMYIKKQCDFTESL